MQTQGQLQGSFQKQGKGLQGMQLHPKGNPSAKRIVQKEEIGKVCLCSSRGKCIKSELHWCRFLCLHGPALQVLLLPLGA